MFFPLILLTMTMNKGFCFYKLFLLILCLSLFGKVGYSFSFSPESLNYRVMYKWGLVNKQAGHATLSLTTDGNIYNTRLVAASESWADHFFKVRDTLIGVVEQKDFRPLLYNKLTHEGGDRGNDLVEYSYSGTKVTGKCYRRKWNKKGEKTVDQTRTLTATGLTLDMLSAFYFMRSRPYTEWKPGHTQSVNLFSGKRKEILTITFIGIDTIEVDKRSYRTYHISFTFTDPSKPKNQTSDPMEAWIGADNKRIPIKLEGKLKVGKVQCFYMP